MIAVDVLTKSCDATARMRIDEFVAYLLQRLGRYVDGIWARRQTECTVQGGEGHRNNINMQGRRYGAMQYLMLSRPPYDRPAKADEADLTEPEQTPSPPPELQVTVTLALCHPVSDRQVGHRVSPRGRPHRAAA